MEIGKLYFYDLLGCYFSVIWWQDLINIEFNFCIAAVPQVREERPVMEEAVMPCTAPIREAKAMPIYEATKPTFTERLHNSRLVEGTNIIFDCKVEGLPFPEILWKERDFPITEDRR